MDIDAEMFVRLQGPARLGQNTVNQLAYDLASSFPDAVNVWREPRYPRKALEIVSPTEGDDCKPYELQGKLCWLQDGPIIVAEPEEQFIRVSLSDRYYGLDYERGLLPRIYMVTKWIRQKVGNDIWYGGDSSGTLMEPMDEETLMKLWLDVGNLPYRNAFSSFRGTPAPVCTFCPDVPMSNCGGGGQDSTLHDYWVCFGCRVKVITGPNVFLEVTEFSKRAGVEPTQVLRKDLKEVGEE